MMAALTILVPTIGRLSLARTLRSLANQPLDPDDEVLVIGEGAPVRALAARFGYQHVACARGRHWGCEERTLGLARARRPYLAFLDDDDAWTPGARAALAAAIADTPTRPSLFRMRYPDGRTLWADPVLRCGNVGTAMMLLPNDPTKLGRWTTRYEGDFDFLASMTWAVADIAWRPIVIAEVQP